MAEVTKGEVKTNTTYDSYFWVRWSIEETFKTSNPPVTRINWSCGVTPGHKFYLNAIKMSAVTINGTQVYAGGTYSNFTDYKEHTLGSGTLDISHSTDGTKTFKISKFTGWLYGGYNYTGAETSFTLPKIDTKAIITSADNFSNTSLKPKVNYTNPSGYSFDACIAMHKNASGSWIADIPDNSYISVGSDKSGTWTFDLTDTTKYPGAINKLQSLTANTTSLPFRFYLRTTINGTPLYSHIDKTFTVTKNSETEPKLNPSITVDDDTWGVTGSNNIFIKGITSITVAARPQAQWGASVKRCSIKCGNDTITSSAGIIQNVQSKDVVFTVTDSRGFTTTTTHQGTLIDYFPTTAVLSVSNINGEGEADLQISGNFFDGSFGVSTNALVVQYRYKVEDGEYGNWISVPYNLPGDGRYTTQPSHLTGFDYTKKVTFQARAYDMLTSAITDEQARKAVPVFHWGKDVFSFNTDVVFEGREQTGERQIVFKNNTTDPTKHKHHCVLYGGNPNSTTGIGFWDFQDGGSGKGILWYNDYANKINIGTIDSQILINTLPVKFMGAASLTNTPSGYSGYGRAIEIGSTGTTKDKYYLLIDSTGRLYTGVQLNTATTITWKEK